MEILKTILHQVGIDEDRVWLRWISASEGGLFRDTMEEMVAAIRNLGPNPMRKGWKVSEEIFGMWRPKGLSVTTGG